jgi:microsomal epoxide hydrolase
MTSIPFGKPPNHVSTNLAPFQISVSDIELDKLKTLLEYSPIAPPNWANSRADGSLGLSRDKLIEMVEYWHKEYDWQDNVHSSTLLLALTTCRRKWESTMNSFPQFKLTVPDDDDRHYDIHFLALFSTNTEAVPVLLLHGWPGSVVEFLPLLLQLRSHSSPGSLPYHLIVPHYIGYGFSSSPPPDRAFTHVDNARLLAKMMHTLGFGSYVVQGGDLGSATATAIGSRDPACKLVHVNLLPMPPPPGVDVEADIKAGKYTTDEMESLKSTQQFLERGNAFIKLDGTKPATVGFVIGSSPISLLAWIGEKIITWSDEAPSLDLILTNISMYWFSGCFPTSLAHHQLILEDSGPLMDGWKDVKVPLGYSWFKNELANPPKAWIDQTQKVSWYRKHEKVSSPYHETRSI